MTDHTKKIVLLVASLSLLLGISIAKIYHQHRHIAELEAQFSASLFYEFKLDAPVVVSPQCHMHIETEGIAMEMEALREQLRAERERLHREKELMKDRLFRQIEEMREKPLRSRE